MFKKRIMGCLLALALGAGTALPAAALAPAEPAPVQQQTASAAWEGVFSGEVDFPIPSDQLGAAVAARQAEGRFDTELARSVVDKINDLRAAPNVWYWASDAQTEKTVFNKGGADDVPLPALQYNTNLELLAQRRAVEMSLHVDATERPDGSRFPALCAEMNVTQDVRSSFVNGYNENVSFEDCLVEWIAEDGSYREQGLRRLWLDPFAQTVGIACFNCHGANFWCFVFGRDNTANGTVGETGDGTVGETGTDPADDSQVRAFVTRLYEVCLGRTPDEAGLDGWTDALISHRNTGSQAAYGFIFSDEFKNKNYCNSCYIDHLYSAFMGREPDAEGHAGWIRVLEEEGQSREHVFNGFVGSDEFKAICAQYGIDPGTGTAEPEGVGTVRRGTCAGCGATDGVEDFVVRLYRVCLDRAPDENAQAWMENLRMHKDTGRTVAEGFIFSPEFTARGFDNETFVQYMYRAFFDREPKDGEESGWVTDLNGGGSRETVMDGFTGSDEFTALCRRYGILAQ